MLPRKIKSSNSVDSLCSNGIVVGSVVLLFFDYSSWHVLNRWRSLLNNIAIASQDDKCLYFEFILEIMARYIHTKEAIFK